MGPNEKPGQGAGEVAPDRIERPPRLVFAYGATSIGFLILDVMLPLGVAAGVPYVALVLLSFWSPRQRDALYLGIGGTALTIAGYLLSPQGQVPWIPLANRGLAILAIWITAIACLHRKHSEDRFRNVVEAAPNAILLVDGEGTITMTNREAERMFGYERNGLVGQPVELLVPERVRERHPDNRDSYFRTPKSRAMGTGRELFAVRKDGGEFPVEIGLNPIRAGEKPMVLGAVVDISARKEIETRLQTLHLELEKHAAELTRSNDELAQFAYVASHDLKAPLRGISNLADWIREDAHDHLPDASRKHLEQLLGRIRRMERLLDDLLAYSRVGRCSGETEELDTALVVKEVVELLQPPDGFTVSVADDLPLVRAERSPYSQVFLNLIGNAVKHHDRTEGRVEVSVDQACDELTFIIADDGPGIPPNYRDRIFGMFQTLRPRDVVEGSGMGLALVRKIVEGAGGSIRVESRGERGSRFLFTWPGAERPVGRNP